MLKPKTLMGQQLLAVVAPGVRRVAATALQVHKASFVKVSRLPWTSDAQDSVAK